MAMLFGRQYSKKELMQRFGDLSQVADAREGTLSSGRADGMRTVDFKTGSGLEFTVFPSRGMDIGWASYQGKPISFFSKAGPVKPEFYDNKGRGFMRSFYCGLLTGCGISHMGKPCDDDGEHLGQQGRLSHTPAHDVCVSREWDGDDYILAVDSKVREACVFKENLLLRRKIVTKLGGKTIEIHDVYENQGFEPAPIILLYHINFGYPVVSGSTKLHLSEPTQLRARDPHAEKDIDKFDRFSEPEHGFREQVYYHKLNEQKSRFAACLYNEEMDYGVSLSWNPSQMPHICQWKMCGEGDYAVGIEPCNAPTSGRVELREAGILPYLQPGETKHVDITIDILESKDELQAALSE